MGMKSWTAAGAGILCVTALAGCGTASHAPLSSRAIETTPTTTTTVASTPVVKADTPTAVSNEPTQNTPSTANLSSGHSDAAVVNSPAAQDQGSWTDPTNLPGITAWDTSNYHAIANHRVARETYSLPLGEVALTVDDGPSPYTQRMLDVLKAYHAHATFFFVGENVKQYPSVVQNAATNGNLVEDHSMTHPNFFSISPQQQLNEINENAHLIESLTNQPVRLFRPPYENFNNVTEQILQHDGMGLALWNRDPRDWAARSPADIVHGVLDNAPSGGVFDLHDKELTLEALPDILRGLAALNLKVVVLPTNQIPGPAATDTSQGSVASASGTKSTSKDAAHVPVNGTGNVTGSDGGATGSLQNSSGNHRGGTTNSTVGGGKNQPGNTASQGGVKNGTGSSNTSNGTKNAVNGNVSIRASGSGNSVVENSSASVSKR